MEKNTIFIWGFSVNFIGRSLTDKENMTAEKIQWIYNVLQFLIVCISLAYGIIYWKKIKQHRYLNLFPIYIAGSMSVALSWFFKFPGIIIQNIFILFEFSIFYDFFRKVLNGKKFQVILVSLISLFFLSVVMVGAFLYTNKNEDTNIISFLNHNDFSEIIVIENILIVIPVLLYYISIFNRHYIDNLSTEPIFLAMTGIIFCMVLPIPVYAFQNMIINHNKELYIYLYTINSIAYIIMHLFFIRAFKCLKY